MEEIDMMEVLNDFMEMKKKYEQRINDICLEFHKELGEKFEFNVNDYSVYGQRIDGPLIYKPDMKIKITF